MNEVKIILSLIGFMTFLIPNQANAQSSITCDVYGNAISPTELSYTLFKINDTITEYNGCGISPAIMVAIIDTNCQVLGTKFGTDNLDNDFGNSNSDGACRPRVEYHFTFQQDSPLELDSLESLLNNKIPDGYDVLIYSWRFLDSTIVADNSSTLFSSMNALGWTNFGTQDTVPFILFGEMGNPTSFQEIYGSHLNEFITFSDSICYLPESGTGGHSSLIDNEKSKYEFLVYPQPAKDLTHISIFSELNMNMSISIFNLNGASILKESRNVIAGENNFDLDVKELASGIYIIRFFSSKGEEIHSRRFVKL